jgi:hypothetical protein
MTSAGFGKLGRPRTAGLACASAATGLGLCYLLAAGAPARYLVVNAAALLLGIVAFRGMAGAAGQAGLFGDPGVYDLLTVIVSAALMLLVMGYVARSRRDPRESLAYAAVVAIIALPILGYAVEGRPGPWAKPPALVPPGESTVSDESTMVAWAALTLLLFVLDRRRQRASDRRRTVG